MTGEVLKGPLSAYQSTSARDQDDVLRLAEAIYQIMPANERREIAEVTKSLRDQWDALQASLSEIPYVGLEEILSEFKDLFRRKTFQESMYDCLNQDWHSRYNGARDTLNKLKEHEPNKLEEACGPFVSDVYVALMATLDAYSVGLSKLLGTGDSPIHAETGRLLFDNPGIASACERYRQRILGLVASLSDKEQAPTFDEAFRFEEAEAFEQKKWLIHHGKSRADGEKAHPDASRRVKFAQKLELDADSLWDFDRILYFQCHEEGGKLDLKGEVNRARRELEKANAKGEGVSLMALNYSLGPVEKALSAPLAEAQSRDVKLLCDDIREFIKRTDTDKGGHVRAMLARIEASLPSGVEVQRTEAG